MADYVPLEPLGGEITISSYILHLQQVQRLFGDLPLVPICDGDGTSVIHIDNV